jgi:hypothetical protein
VSSYCRHTTAESNPEQNRIQWGTTELPLDSEPSPKPRNWRQFFICDSPARKGVLGHDHNLSPNFILDLRPVRTRRSRIRLNGWHRIGVVASVVWALIGGWWGHSEHVENAWRMGSLTYNTCSQDEVRLQEPDLGECRQKAAATFEKAREGHWTSAAIAGLLPIPLGWLVAYGFIGLVRWIETGFNR